MGETKKIVADLCHQYVPSVEKNGKTTMLPGGVIFPIMTTRSSSAQTAHIFSQMNEEIWILSFHPQKPHFFCILWRGGNMLLKRMTITLLWLMTRLDRATSLEHCKQKIMLSIPTDFSMNRYHLNLCFYSIWFLNKNVLIHLLFRKEKVEHRTRSTIDIVLVFKI